MDGRAQSQWRHPAGRGRRDKSATSTFKLPPGKYIVEGIWKAIVVQRDVDLPAGKPHTELFNYNAGPSA